METEQRFNLKYHNDEETNQIGLSLVVVGEVGGDVVMEKALHEAAEFNKNYEKFMEKMDRLDEINFDEVSEREDDLDEENKGEGNPGKPPKN